MTRGRQKNNAFTMLELLIVIGIIALLGGITLYAMRHITASSKISATKVSLENLRAMLGEVETQTKFNRSPAEWLWQGYTPNGIVVATVNPSLSFWQNPGQNPEAPPVTYDLDAPGLVTLDSGTDSLGYRNASRAVINTGLAMTQLASVPSNRAALQGLRSELLFIPEFVPNGDKFPSPGQDHVLRTGDDAATGDASVYPLGARVRYKGKNYISLVAGNGNTALPDTSSWKEDPSPIPMMLDGWNNPIIFVPAAGLRVRLLLDEDKNDPGNVNQTRIVTSAGVIKVPTTVDAARFPPGAKPFWASAGPDGDFNTGDDNVYSFEN